MSSAAKPARADTALTWSLIVALAGGIAVGAAFAPLEIAAAIVCLAVAALTLTRHGAIEGAWYLLLFTLPLREPLGYDIVGTKTLYASDVLWFLLTLIMLLRAGVARLWRESSTLRIGVAILVISAISLYTRNDTNAIESVFRLVGQVAIFFVARHVVHDGRIAERTILWFMAGMVPAILYGFYQASIPLVGASFASWASLPIAFDSAGTPHIRAFSTFEHTLAFTQALAVTFGLAVALLLARTSAALRWFALITAILAGICNQLTYSVSGILGSAAALVTAVLGQPRRWLVWLLPIIAVIAIVIAPNALFERASHLLTGQTLSTVARVVTYEAGVRALVEHPVLGVGWGGLPELREEYMNEKSLGQAPENFFLHRAASLGVPGLILYVTLTVVFFRNWRRSRGVDPAWPRLAVLVGGVAYFTQAMFIPSEYYTNNYFLWILFAIAEKMSREANSFAPGERRQDFL